MLVNMTEGKPLKLILPFMVPLLIGNVFQQMYNIADIIIVGRTIGVQALAAVGAVSPLFMILVMLTIGMGNGFAVVTGQRYGANNMLGVKRSIATSILLSIVFVILIMLCTNFFIDTILDLMNVPPLLLSDSKNYLLIITDGLIAMMAYNLLSGIMRSLGDSKTPLYFLIISSLVNIILALIFIIYFGWGVPGSAFALVIAQAISAVLCIIYIYCKFPQLHICRKNFIFCWREMWAHLRMGVPMALQFVILGLGIILVQAVCNKFGADIIAGFTTAIRVEQLALQPMVSFGIAMAVFTAQNYGARKFDRIKEAVRKCSAIAFAFSLISAVLLFIFGEEIIGIFLDNPDAEVLQSAQLYIFYTVPCYFFLSQIFIFRNAVQGMGISMVPMISGVVELLMRVIAAFYLADIFGYIGICLAEPISWISASIFLFSSYLYFMKVLSKKA